MRMQMKRRVSEWTPVHGLNACKRWAGSGLWGRPWEQPSKSEVCGGPLVCGSPGLWIPWIDRESKEIKSVF